MWPAGTWTPLNIVVAFACGALLFGELDGFSGARFAVLGVAFLAVVAGVLLIAGARDEPGGGRAAGSARAGLLWAAGAGVLWGTYFVPAQWAKVPAQVSDFPLALGILAGSLALALPAGEPVRVGVRATSALLEAGVLFGIGNLTLLGLVARAGAGTGFTIAQLSLLVNASLGIRCSAFPNRAPARRASWRPASCWPASAAASSSPCDREARPGPQRPPSRSPRPRRRRGFFDLHRPGGGARSAPVAGMAAVVAGPARCRSPE